LAGGTVAPGSASSTLSEVLDSPELTALVADLDDLQWTGRKGYGTRTLLGACLIKSLYALPTWTRTTRLIAEHDALREAIGGAPSQWACYRFAVKLRQNKPALDACLTALAASLRAQYPELGRDVAIDASDMAGYGNGQRLLSKDGPVRERYSDPDASWGHRSAISTRKGGGFYGYRLHAAVCVATGLPVAWEVKTARAHETLSVPPLLAVLAARGFKVASVAMDKAYDNGPIYDACTDHGAVAIFPLRETPSVKRGDHLAPACEHGTWQFAGADFKRNAAKWRCPRASAILSLSGARLPAFIRSTPARRSGGAACTGAAPLWSGSSDG
jgi:hypothetical protein